MTHTPQASPTRLPLVLGGVALLLAGAGAVSFVRYARRHAPNPRLVAVAPFDVFAPALDRWRVGLADALTRRLAGAPPLEAVPQAVVAATWRSAPRPEIAAVELARRTGAAAAVYGRVDPLDHDSVRVNLIVVEALSTRVLFGVMVRWPAADLDGLAGELAEHVRHRYPP
jgi:hypothetical protein